MEQYDIWQKDEIETYKRRIKELEENPDPMVLKSEKLFWELYKERIESEMEAYREGRPTCEGTSNSVRFLRAMGIQPFDFPGSSDEVAETQRYPEYKRALENMGYPEKSCERIMLPVIMSELGHMPKPTLQINCGKSCDLKKYFRRGQGTIFNIPVFYIDCPLNEDDEPDLVGLNYIAEQLGEFIEWAEEKVPGVKYNKDLHLEALEMDAIGQKLSIEMYQLIKHVPCPIGPLDGRRKLLIRLFPSRYPNMKKAIEFLRICRDELGERVASGQGVPEERLRLLWAGNVPQKKILNVGKVFAERNIAVPLNVAGWVTLRLGLRCKPIGAEVSEYGIKLSPLQEEARMYNNAVWGGPGKRWANSVMTVAQDLGAQGIIHWLVIGCIPMRSLGSMVAERAEKELGIPTLNVEGRLHDRDYMTIERFEEMLSPFVDKCLSRAGQPRQ